jgi:hypothetical protein
MKRELLISFLPPVLLCVAIRLALAVAIVFRPDVLPSIGAAQEWALVLTALAGVPALIVFAGARLWIARAKMKNLGVIFASVSLSAAIMWIGFGEPYWRLLSKKAEYDAFAATHPQDEVIVFDWGDAPGPIPFDWYKEYLVIARGSRVKTFEAYTGQVIGSWGDERSEVDGILSAAWPENDRYRRFGTGKFDACNMRIAHLTGHYYYAVDFC